MNPGALDIFLETNADSAVFSLAITAAWTWDIEVETYQMIPGASNLTYSGFADNNIANKVWFLATSDYFRGWLISGNKRYRFQPVWGLLGPGYAGHFIVIESTYTPPAAHSANLPEGYLEIGIEVDYETYQHYGGNTQTMIDKILDFINEVQYFYDMQDNGEFNITFAVNGIFFQTAPDNFYGPASQVSERVRIYWNSYRGCIPKDVILLFSGNDIGLGHQTGSLCPVGTQSEAVIYVSLENSFWLDGDTQGILAVDIAHELGHLLTHRDHIDNNDNTGYCPQAAGLCGSADSPLMCTTASDDLESAFLDVCTRSRIANTLNQEGIGAQGCLSNEPPSNLPMLPCPETDCALIQIDADNTHPVLDCDDQSTINYTITICDVCPDQMGNTYDIVVKNNGLTEQLLPGGDFTDISYSPGNLVRTQQKTGEYFADLACKTYRFSTLATGEAFGGNPVEVSVRQGTEVLNTQELTLDVATSADFISINGTSVPARLSTSAQLSAPNADCELSGGKQNIKISGTLEIDLDNLPGISCYTFKTGSLIKLEPEAKIVVKGGALRLLGCKVFGCTNLWESIIVESGATLIADESLIQDAQYAIKPLPGATVDLRYSTFRNNHISFYTTPSGSPYQTQQTDLVQCFGNTFESTPEGLKPPMTGQKSLAGIWVNDLAGINIGQEDAGPNYFRNMQNGVVALNSNIRIIRSVFEDINETYPTANPFINGVGVYAKADPYKFRTLEVKGLGKTGSYAFSQCSAGVQALSMNASVDNCNMRNMQIGIAVSGGRYRRINLTNNQIPASAFGIGLFQNTPAKVSVEGNRLIADGLNGASTGIAIDENPYGIATYTYYWLNNNLVEMKAAEAGIRIRGGRFIQAYDNTIEMYQDRQQDGLRLQGSPDAWVRCNTASLQLSQSAVQDSRGLFAAASPGSLISCNTTENTRLGLLFDGMTDNTAVKGNNIYSHHAGLQIAPNGSIGVQQHYGNKWYGTYSDKGARHLGNDEDFTNLSQFIVEESLSNGQSYDFLPDWSAIGQWFLDPPNDNGENTFYCQTVAQDACSSELAFPEGFKDQLDDLDKALAQGNASEGIFAEVLNWSGRRHLYRRIQERGLTPEQGSVVANFVLAASASDIGSFFSVENQLRNTLKPNAYRQDALYATLDNIQSALHNLEDNSSDLLKTASAGDSLALLAQRATLLGQIADDHTYADGLVHTLESNANNGAAWLETENDALPDTTLYQYNEKAYHRVFLATIGAGVYTFDSLQQAQLFAVASQCPLPGGDAVYWARAAYALAVPNATYNDSLLCAQAQPIAGKPKRKDSNPEFDLYPNPARDFVALQPRNLNEAAEVTIMVYDMLARERIRLSSKGNQAVLMDIGNMNAGTYWVVLQGEHHRTGIRKLIITP